MLTILRKKNKNQPASHCWLLHQGVINKNNNKRKNTELEITTLAGSSTKTITYVESKPLYTCANYVQIQHLCLSKIVTDTQWLAVVTGWWYTFGLSQARPDAGPYGKWIVCHVQLHFADILVRINFCSVWRAFDNQELVRRPSAVSSRYHAKLTEKHLKIAGFHTFTNGKIITNHFPTSLTSNNNKEQPTIMVLTSSGSQTEKVHQQSSSDTVVNQFIEQIPKWSQNISCYRALIYHLPVSLTETNCLLLSTLDWNSVTGSCFGSRWLVVLISGAPVILDRARSGNMPVHRALILLYAIIHMVAAIRPWATAVIRPNGLFWTSDLRCWAMFPCYRRWWACMAFGAPAVSRAPWYMPISINITSTVSFWGSPWSTKKKKNTQSE